MNEAPYRVDRMLTSLRLGGHLARASAVVFGGLRPMRTRAGRLDRRRGARIARHGALGIPVLAGAPFGHGAQNEAFVLGARARVAGDEVSLSCGAGGGGMLRLTRGAGFSGSGGVLDVQDRDCRPPWLTSSSSKTTSSLEAGPRGSVGTWSGQPSPRP